MIKPDDLSLTEVSQELGKSKRTITRYIKKSLLNPDRIKTKRGLEYRFKRSEVDSLKSSDTTGQETRQNIKIDRDDDTLSLLNDTIKLLQK